MKYKLIFIMLLVSLLIGCSGTRFERVVMHGEVKSFKYINHSAGTSDVTIITFKNGTKISLVGIHTIPCKHIYISRLAGVGDYYAVRPDWDKEMKE